MTTFETIAKHETEYGQNNFVEIARKVAKGENGQTEFVSVTRGYIDSTGARRYKTNLTLPNDPEVIGFVTQALGDV